MSALRYDLQKPERELWGRQASFRPDVMNPKVGRLGGILYENQCNCTLASTYPYAIAPRIGVAYQINPKTVLRAGWGFSYSTVNNFGYIGASPSTGFNTISFGATDIVNNGAAGKLSDGLHWNPSELYGAAYDQGYNSYITGTSLQNAVGNVDPNGGRPPRVNQWNISLQREITKNLVVEAAYVGNRGVWFQNNARRQLQRARPQLPELVVFPPRTESDRRGRPLAADRHHHFARGASRRASRSRTPNFPDNGTVIQSLRPYPQYNGIGATWAPLGNTWYDALQVKATKRYSNGLDATVSYAYSKNLTNIASATGNVFDRSTFKGLSPEDRPHILTISINYAMPAYGFAQRNAFTRALLSGWTIGSVLQYQSGILLASPTSNNSIGTYYPGQSSRQFRVPGVPLYTKDLNCGCIKPEVDTVLNPAAWVDAPARHVRRAADLLRRLPRPAPSRRVHEFRQALRVRREEPQVIHDSRRVLQRLQSPGFSSRSGHHEPANRGNAERPGRPDGRLWVRQLQRDRFEQPEQRVSRSSYRAVGGAVRVLKQGSVRDPARRGRLPADLKLGTGARRRRYERRVHGRRLVPITPNKSPPPRNPTLAES